MTTKTCSTCKIDKAVAEFRKAKRLSDGLSSRCKQCAKTAYHARYKDHYAAGVRDRNKRISTTNRNTISAYKAQTGCKLCAEKEPACLEFHHLDPTQKEFGVAHKMALSIELLWEEIGKCILLCSNCHKKVHAGLVALADVEIQRTAHSPESPR